MKYIYTFYVWTIGILTFSLISIISSPILYFVKPEKYTPIFRVMMKFLLTILFIRVKVTGKENIRDSENYIFMPNHVSMLDPIIITSILPKYTIAIEEKRNFSYPIYGWLIKSYRNIPINRKSIMSSKKTFDEVRERVKAGQNVVIFPEGGRTLNGKLRPFKKLLFKTANEAGKPIMPVGMNGIFEINKKGSIWMTPNKVEVNFGSEITSQEVQDLSIEDLSAKTRTGILSLLEEKYHSS